MKHLTKTLAVLTLAAGSFGLTLTAQAHDRLTVICSNSGHHTLPLAHWNYRPYAYRHHHTDRHGHSHAYRHRSWERHDRHRDEDKRSGRDRGDDRHGYRGKHDNRISHSAYGKGSRY